MKRNWCFPVGFCGLAIASLCLAVGPSSVARAQSSAPPTASPSTLVAVVNLTKVFESHPTLKTQLESVQQQLKGVERDFDTKQKELSNRGKALSDLSPTSDEYKRLESELVRQVADLQVQARQAKKDFLQREALQYYSVYNEITAAVHEVAQRHNIGLVLRFDDATIDPSSPQSVAQGMSRSVVVQRNLDITHLVVNQLQLAAARNTPNGASRR